MPQSIQSMNELMDLTAIPYNIIGPKDGKPVIGIVQDTLLGVFRITKDSIRVKDKVMANLQMVNSYFDVMPPLKPGEVSYTGRQVYSQILPPGLFLESSNKNGKVSIRDGQLVAGNLDKSSYNSMSKGLTPVVFHDYGPFEARRLLDNTQRLICRWLMTDGFSVGISDLVVDEDVSQIMSSTISTMKQQVYDKINAVRSGRMESHPLYSNQDYFEIQIGGILNESTGNLSKAALSKINDTTNRMINMIKSGSKGSDINVAQMVGCLGQQNVDSKRIAYGFTDRTLPHYTKFDDGPEARGFVESNFIGGLSPQEVFFHAMGGREGLIDTAVKSVTGETTIVILENDIPKYVKIGDWIDAHLAADAEDVAHFEERQMELLYIKNKVFIPTTDYDGKVTWGEVTAVTRHDPGTELYEIKTSGGKKVIVTESKSLLIWHADIGQFKEVLTPSIKVGDCVPVTAMLCAPPTVVKSVDMTAYFPKTKYIHGTEFNKAKRCIDVAMEGRGKIPIGWWAANNGTTFTLPYKKKAHLTRTIGRSNTENIKDGCIYPFHATREHSLVPDKMVLNKENGIFIGLFLAEGHACDHSGTVTITNNDVKVRAFVKNWFDTYSIAHSENIKENHIGGTTSVVIGYSSLMARFLDAFVGCGAANKYVPDAAFVAPDEFVIGILNGYFSGDGTVSKTSIEAGSASARLIEGISMLCTRIGVFGKVFTTQLQSNNLGTVNIAPSHRIAIRAQWARTFADKVEFILESKNAQLKQLQCTLKHRNFDSHNDVVLDKIVEISILDVSAYPKVYDLTIPSTLNFGLANGLQVRDTSETGYLQRRLVKAMEDCKIYYDYTVRNASGVIVQFLYGEDGMEGTKIENQFLPHIQMNLLDMENTYLLRKEDNLELHLTPMAFKSLRESPKWADDCRTHFQQLLDDREFIITKVFKNDINDSITFPIPFGRIVNTAFHRLEALGLTSQPSDLTPAYILGAIERLSEQLYVAQKGAKELPFLYILLRLHLSPKVMIFKHHINVAVFDWICSEIVRCFKEAVAQPGEMVGIIAAQSIGEPATQLSVKFDTRISVAGEENFTGKIGEFIGRLLSENPEKVINLGGDSVVMDLEKDYNIIGVSDTEKSGWRRISQISRHPANGQLMTVTTRSGRKTTATLSHSFLKRITDRIIPVEGSKLKVGDRIPVARKIPTVVRPSTVAQIQNKPMNLDKQFGWIVGAYLADGYVNGNNVGISKMHTVFETNIREFQERYPEIIDEVSVRRSNGTMSYIRNNKSVDGEKERVSKVYESKSTFMKGKGFAEFMLANFGTGSNDKRIPAWVYASNIEFIRGVVSGYFDGDGNTNGTKASIRVHSVNEGMIDDFIILLAYCGVFCTKLLESKKNKAGNEDGREQDLQVLLVSRKYARHFRDTIGFQTDYKAEGLDQIIEYNDREDRATSQEMVDKIPELGSTIAYIGKMLELPGQSRNYGRWRKKESIGRDTLAKFIEIFKAENAKPEKSFPCVATQIRILEQAVNSDVVWDEIIQIDYLDDPKEYVYDFTVPGNDSFMVDAGVLVHNTLNSVEWPTKMLMKIDGKLETLQIGEYIDKMMVTIDPKDIEDHPHDTKLGWIRNHKVEVLACTEDGKIIWDNVQAVTRHPVVNKDGTNTLLKVTLRSGREVVATKAKSFLKKVGNKILAVDGDVLKVGDHIPISKVLPVGEEIDTFDGIALTAEAGAAMGASLGDTFPTELLTAPKAYLEALVTGFFSARAGVAEAGLDVLEAMQQVLVRLGVQSEIHMGDNQTYTLTRIEKDAYDIIPEIELSTGLSKAVPREQLAALAASASPEDLQVLEAIKAEEVMYDEIIKIEEIVSQHPYVYDLTVENTKNFNTYSGIAMRDTFHLSGTSAASKATRGVPRLKELLSVSKNIKAPSLQIYLLPSISENKDRSTEVLNRLEICRLVNILDYTEIYWDPPGATGLDTGVTDDKDMLAVYRAFADAQPNRPPSTSPWVLRLGLNKEKMFRAGVTMLDIYMKILNNYGHTVECMFSDDNTDNLVFRIRMYELLASNKEFKDIDQDDAAAGLKAVEWNLVNHMLLKGMTKINKVSMSEQKIEKYIPDLKEFAVKAEWILDTDGSNLLEILADQNVDGTRTISNDIWEIYQVLGIEAARAALYNEIHEVIRESSVNFRHIALLIDTMTSRGALMPIDRHGINRGDVGPLAKSSFEETTEMLIKASIFGEYDRINGVSANIMLGQMPPCGTGDSEILLDEERYMELLQELPKKTKTGPRRGPGATEAEAEAEPDIPSCSAAVIGFSYTLPEKRASLAAPVVTLKA